MSYLVSLGRILTRWYVYSLILAGLGIAIGYALFFHLAPGRPEIGVIDVPFAVLDDDTAFTFGEMLDYAQLTPSIKAVVIRLNSPGGGAAASEQLFLKTAKLREKKPVVVVVQDIAASGGYLWSMGSNYIYAKPTSFVGSVGAILFLPRPRPPEEDVVSTGPAKLTGAPQRTFVGILEMVKEAFLETVMSQRGEKLQLTRQQVSEARIYPGMEAVRLGLVDAIGSDTEATEKAASLAGISHYRMVDVNAEVLRIFIQKLRRILATSDQKPPSDSTPGIKTVRELLSPLINKGNGKDGVVPGLPSDLNLPKIYYLYVAPVE